VIEQAHEIWDRLRSADLTHHAGAVAFHTFLALVPLNFAMLGVAGAIGSDADAVAGVRRALEPIAPESVTTFVTDLLVDAGDRLGDAGLWVILGSVLVALLLGSRAIVALQRALGEVDDRISRRPALSLRAVSVGLTVAGGFAILLSGVTLVAGRRFFEFLGELTGIGVLVDLWVWLRLPIAALGLYGFLLACYHFAPPEPLPRPYLAASIATSGVLVGSLGFGLYLGWAPALGGTFGTFGAVAVAMVWLYLGAIAILAGAVIALMYRPRSELG
jgi:membrane protein